MLAHFGEEDPRCGYPSRCKARSRSTACRPRPRTRRRNSAVAAVEKKSAAEIAQIRDRLERHRLVAGASPLALRRRIRFRLMVMSANGGRGLLRVAYVCPAWRRPRASEPSESAGQTPFHEAERRAWDSNPRDRSPGLAVFKTAAIVH